MTDDTESGEVSRHPQIKAVDSFQVGAMVKDGS